MAIYAIADLHLSSDNKKSMEVFGDKWTDYMKRIKENWNRYVTSDDTVIIPGDTSWAMYLDEAYDDFKYLNDLPGKKIILKGNHDYWWTTLNKMNKFLGENGFNNIFFVHNNSVLYEDTLICGSRGWICPGSEEFTDEDDKIFRRELIRLKNSLEAVGQKSYKMLVAAMHYPPFDKMGRINSEIHEMLKAYKVDMCIFGHIHGTIAKNMYEGEIDGIQYKLVAADYLDFMPYTIRRTEFER